MTFFLLDVLDVIAGALRPFGLGPLQFSLADRSVEVCQ
jgi:hypothetical protein